MSDVGLGPDPLDLLSMQTPNPEAQPVVARATAMARRSETEATADRLIPQAPRPRTGGLQGEMQAAGFSDEEIVRVLKFKQTEMRAAGFTEAEITRALVGNLTPPKEIPQPFIDRFITGSAFERVYKSIGKGMSEGWGPGPVGIDPTGPTNKFLEDVGIFGKPGDASPVRLLNEATLYPAVTLADAALRAISAGFKGFGFGTAQMGEELNPMSEVGTRGSEVTVDKAGREIAEGLDIVALLTLGTPFTKARRMPDGSIQDVKVGGIPTPEDFGNAARTIAGPASPERVQQKLIDLYVTKGIHPSEVAADAVEDVTISQRLLAASDELPYEGTGGTLRAAEQTPQTLGGGGGRKPPPDEEIIPPSGPGEPPIGQAATIDIATDEATTAAFAGVRKKISIGEQSGDEWSLADIYRKTFDRLFGLQQAEVAASGKLADTAADSPTKLARLMAGGPLKAQTALRFGIPNFFNPSQLVSRGFEEIIKPIAKFKWRPDQTPMESFSTFLAATRALELENRGIKSGFNVDEAFRVVNAAPPQVKAAAMELYNYQNQLAAYLRDAGILSVEGYDAMLQANKFYIPFHRLIEEEALRGGGRSFQAFNPVKYIKGSEREIVDPLETIIRNTYTFLNLADRNVVGTKLIDALLRAEQALPAGIGRVVRVDVPPSEGFDKALTLFKEGVNRPLDDMADELFTATSKPGDHGHFSIYRNGRKETYLIDPDLAKALKGLDEDNMNIFTRILAVPASALRAGVVVDPRFWSYFLIRDFFYAQATYPGVFTPADTVKGLVGLIVKDKDYIRWAMSGGGNASISSLDRRYLQESIENLTHKTGLTTRAWNVIIDPESSYIKKLQAGLGLATGLTALNRYVVHPARLATSVVLEANKLGAFKKFMRGKEVSKENLLEAAWVSRETGVDPARIGANMRALNAISAFANATIQDPVRLFRAFKDRPIQTGLAALGVALPSVMLWMVNKDDSRYRGLPRWQKDLFWIVLTDDWVLAQPNDAVGRPPDQVRTINGQLHVNNGTIYRIPKPFAWGVIMGSGPERILEQFMTENPADFSDFSAEMLKSLYDSSVPSLIPTGMAPLIEQFANESLFSGRTVIPGYLEKLLPEYQYTPYTSETAKVIGSIMGAFPGMTESAISEQGVFSGVARGLTTPAVLDNYIRAWTGGMGQYVIGLLDQALIKSGAVSEPVDPTATLSDIPFVKAFVVRYPSAQEEGIQRFYREYNRNERFYQTWKELMESGDVEAANRVQALGGPAMLVRLTGIRQSLGLESQFIRKVYDNPDWTPDEKRQLIDTAYFRMIELSRAGNAIFEGVE